MTPNSRMMNLVADTHDPKTTTTSLVAASTLSKQAFGHGYVRES